MSRDVEEIFVQTLTALRTQDGQRRGIAYGVTGLIHISAAALLLMAPPLIPGQKGGGGGGAINVRLYTIAGGVNAQSDAPLFEPTLADSAQGFTSAHPDASETPFNDPTSDQTPLGPVRDAAGNGDGTGDGSGEGAGEGQGSEIEAREITPPVETPNLDAAPIVEPEPTPPLIEETPDTAPSEEPIAQLPTQSDVTLLQTTGREDDEAERDANARAAQQAQTTSTSSGSRAGGAPAASLSPPPVTAPVQTTGLQEPPARQPRGAQPSFADIAARARSPYDISHFPLSGFGPVTGDTVSESLCLASSDATREAAECPPGANPEAARLADYALQQFGEQAPQFLVDLERAIFLRQNGQNGSFLQRWFTEKDIAQRELRETPQTRRRILRDMYGEVDNLGYLTAPVTPDKYQDPNGERIRLPEGPQ